MSEQQQYWFAARTRDKQEYIIRDSLEKLGIEYFLPTHYVLRQLKYRKKRVEVPVIRNLIFVHTTKQIACDVSNKYHVQLFYMKDLLTHGMLVVPDKQMADFMYVMNLDPDGVRFDKKPLTVGARVQIIEGKFCGLEGELLSTSNRVYVVIRLEGVLTASIKVLKDHLRVIPVSEDVPSL